MTRTRYVQAWQCSRTDSAVALVYSQSDVHAMLAKGYAVLPVTIVRHGDGSREYLRGELVEFVKAARGVTT